MCLGVPGKILESRDGDLRMGRVAFGGIVRDVCLEYVPDANVGDWVIVHVGFAISRIDEAEAARTLAYLEEMGFGAKDAVGDPKPQMSNEGEASS